ncbi:MAG: hypothetical protein LBP38_01775, partial [Desulfovibrio sp.]|nr:hypothetical protein [Desulfovibrio sp.]
FRQREKRLYSGVGTKLPDAAFDAKVFEKQAKPDFSKTCGRRLRLRHTNLLSAESKLVSRVKCHNGTTRNVSTLTLGMSRVSFHCRCRVSRL